MVGWQWVYIAWGIPAVILGVLVLLLLSDHPHEARWLSREEREALEQQLSEEKASRATRRRMTLIEALGNPKVLLLACAYFCGTTINYGVEFFLPRILQRWFSLQLDSITWLLLLPPILAVTGQLFVGWSSDRLKERRIHSMLPLLLAGASLALVPLMHNHLALTIACFMVAAFGIKGYQPAFWALPYTFLTEAAAAGSIGLINSVGNLGGFAGPYVVGHVEKITGSFVGGLYYLAFSACAASAIIYFLGSLGKEPERGFEAIMQNPANPR
jgi:ACS family tartrate transporter-like MFS transporter